MKSTKLLALLLVVVMCFGVLSSCFLFEQEQPDPNPTPDDNTVTKEEFTYKGYSTALGTNWNPHTWETNADSGILSYLESPFVSMEAKDTVNGIYQWVYEMAESIEDVTAANKGDLTKYGVFASDADLSEVDSGYVYEIKLNKNAKWENGEAINADTYIESMKRLLSSKYRNYRANLYISGESAVAGGLAYYNSEAPIYSPIIGYDGNTRYEIVDPSSVTWMLDLTTENMTLAGYSFTFMLDYYVDKDLYNALIETANPYGYIEVTADNYADILTICDQYLWAFGMELWVCDFIESEEGNYVWDAESESYVPVAEGEVGTHVYDYVLDEEGNPIPDSGLLEEFFFYNTGTFGDKVEYDSVGCYKVDDYTIRYVCETYIDFNYFLTSCSSTWLVYTPLYDNLTKEEGGLFVTTYGTSVATTMSYGVYKMQTYEDQKQIVFVQNENWYGWEKDEAGNLVSYTDCVNAIDSETGELVPFLVDGEAKQQHITTKIVIDVMTEEAAKQLFLKGELSEWSPPSAELSQYSLSDRLYAVDETYTMSFFFNTNLNALQALDEGANKNSVVLTSDAFRKAMSLAINRADYVSVTQGWTPAFSLMNHLYHYDFFNDPTSSYRASEEAMQAIVNLYGVKYGEGELYKTLKEAHDSITGYNLTEAKELMKQAYAELTTPDENGNVLYNGGDIVIQIGWAKGALQADDNAQVDKLNQYINAALEGSGFGKITFEAVGNIDNRYADTAAGLYAIGYGAWGGAALYPFRNFQVYCDSSQYSLNEAGCWNPATEEATFIVDGVEDTMTWKEWSNSMIGNGKYATATNEVKLQITAQMEQKFLEFYYRIPLAVTTVCSLLSYQMDYYTQTYNMAYGFGGMRLMSYNYNDAEWAEYVQSVGGELNYK